MVVRPHAHPPSDPMQPRRAAATWQVVQVHHAMGSIGRFHTHLGADRLHGPGEEGLGSGLDAVDGIVQLAQRRRHLCGDTAFHGHREDAARTRLKPFKF